MEKDNKKKIMTAKKALMILCAKDYLYSDLNLSSEEEDNVDKLSQNSSVTSDENDNFQQEPSPKKITFQL